MITLHTTFHLIHLPCAPIFSSFTAIPPTAPGSWLQKASQGKEFLLEQFLCWAPEWSLCGCAIPYIFMLKHVFPAPPLPADCFFPIFSFIQRINALDHFYHHLYSLIISPNLRCVKIRFCFDFFSSPHVSASLGFLLSTASQYRLIWQLF